MLQTQHVRRLPSMRGLVDIRTDLHNRSQQCFVVGSARETMEPGSENVCIKQVEQSCGRQEMQRAWKTHLRAVSALLVFLVLVPEAKSISPSLQRTRMHVPRPVKGIWQCCPYNRQRSQQKLLESESRVQCPAGHGQLIYSSVSCSGTIMPAQRQPYRCREYSKGLFHPSVFFSHESYTTLVAL